MRLIREFASLWFSRVLEHALESDPARLHDGGDQRFAARPLRAAVVQKQAMASKVDIYGGKNTRELPLYTIAEAARVGRIHPATLRTWVLGRSYDTQDGSKTWRPLIRRADPKLALLSLKSMCSVRFAERRVKSIAFVALPNSFEKK